MNNNKLIVLQEKSSDKVNIFSISEDSKLISLFNNKENGDLLFFEKELPYFDGIELMLNDKYLFKEITQESWDKCVKLLNLSQYEQETKGDSIYYKKDNKYYIKQNRKTDVFLLDYKLIWSVFLSEIKSNPKLMNYILEEVYKCKIYTELSLYSYLSGSLD